MRLFTAILREEYGFRCSGCLGVRGACLITLLRSTRPPVEANLTPMRQNLRDYRYIVLRERASLERLALHELGRVDTNAIQHAAPDSEYVQPQNRTPMLTLHFPRESMHRPLRPTLDQY